MSRERNSLRASTVLNPANLRVGMGVMAFAEDAQRYWSAVVQEIIDERVGDRVERFVKVKFMGTGTRKDAPVRVRAEDLRPDHFIELKEGKRPRAPSRLSHASHSDLEEGESELERPADAGACAGQPRKRRAPLKERTVVEVSRVVTTHGTKGTSTQPWQTSCHTQLAQTYSRCRK